MNLKLVFIFATLTISQAYSQEVVPLAVGNKWIFNTTKITWQDSTNHLKEYEVLKDTIFTSIQYGTVNCYKVRVSDNSTVHDEYWSADSNKFYIYNPQYFVDIQEVKYDAIIHNDTTWHGGPMNYYVTVKLFDLDFLNIQNRAAQETIIDWPIHGDVWKISYVTAYNFGIAEIHFSHTDWDQRDTVLEKIRGAIINGIIYGDTAVTSAVDQIKSINSFKLSQNYPNPFNPKTKISYSIPQTNFVIIKVYDLIGKEIATLVNEQKTIGNYEVEFDGSNLSSGIYFYKMQAGDFTDTKKLVLIK